ncbi:MAG: DUF3365 domain-containing protein [Rhodospirillaceae bacterium]
MSRSVTSRLLPGLLLSLGLCSQSGAAMAEDTSALASEARSVVQQFSGTLRKALKSALETGGPVAAIEVCNLKAPGIAEQLSEATGWQVGRTAFKLRNPKNVPDDWEGSVLTTFANRAAAGEDITKIEQTEVVERDGHKTFRFMKAIPTAELCVTCHGTSLKPEIQARLNELYPTDQATGFAVGDLRGAFTLSKRLD